MKSIIEQVKNFDIIEQAQSAKEIVSSFLVSYKQQNSWKIRLIDSYIVFCGLLLLIQFVFAFLNGLFPMNSLISGMVVCIGSMTLSGNIIIVIYILFITVSLRLQINPKTKTEDYSNEKVFAEYLIANLILFFVCINFLG